MSVQRVNESVTGSQHRIITSQKVSRGSVHGNLQFFTETEPVVSKVRSGRVEVTIGRSTHRVRVSGRPIKHNAVLLRLWILRRETRTNARGGRRKGISQLMTGSLTLISELHQNIWAPLFCLSLHYLNTQLYHQTDLSLMFLCRVVLSTVQNFYSSQNFAIFVQFVFCFPCFWLFIYFSVSSFLPDLSTSAESFPAS